MSTRRTFLALTGAALLVAACGPRPPRVEAPPTQPEPPPPPPPPVTIAETLERSGQHTVLLRAFAASEIMEALRSSEVELTLFAPTDDAFARLPEGTLDALLADPPRLTAVLAYHLVTGSIDTAALPGVPSVPNMLGLDLAIDSTNGLTIGGAKVVTPDLVATNGRVHAIDTVLLPPE